MKKYLLNILLGIDQLANTVAGGSPDETISSRVGRSTGGLGKVINDDLGQIEADHGPRSIEFTPWGTPDPHHLEPLQALQEDWAAFMQATQEENSTAEIVEKAQRAAFRLRIWRVTGQEEKWKARVRADLEMLEKV